MARKGISYDQVVAVCNELLGENIEPINFNVRARLKTGSDGTIHKYLKAWRASRPQIVANLVEFPKAILAAINQEIARATAEARAEIEGRLVIIQEEADDLASNYELLEEDRDRCLDELNAMTAARDSALREIEEQAHKIDRLNHENERERYSADQARIEVAQLRNKLEIKEEKILEHAAAIRNLTDLNASVSHAKIIAEKEAAVYAAKLAAETEKSGALQTEKISLTRQVDTERLATESARAETMRVTVELANLNAILSEKVLSLTALSGAFEAKKLAHAESEKCVTELTEQLASERIATESAVAKTAILTGELQLSSEKLAETLSAFNDLQVLYDTELWVHCKTRREMETLDVVN